MDRYCFIVATRDGDGLIDSRDGHRLLLDVMEGTFWELDYPVLTVLGLHDHETYHRLGDSLSCHPRARLGRAVTRLQCCFRRRRRWRHRWCLALAARRASAEHTLARLSLEVLTMIGHFLCN